MFVIWAHWHQRPFRRHRLPAYFQFDWDGARPANIEIYSRQHGVSRAGIPRQPVVIYELLPSRRQTPGMT
ncbi:MAG: hypothetical protein HYV02_04050 [Deltaproteobacteria bacterium]|nr:hypothetical protein [Deltaproteobacteria bacterium]